MAEKPALHLEELNLKYEGEKPAKHAYRARIAGGWLVFIWTPGRGGLTAVTFYTDPDHAWDGEPRKTLRVNPSREKKDSHVC